MLFFSFRLSKMQRHSMYRNFIKHWAVQPFVVSQLGTMQFAAIENYILLYIRSTGTAMQDKWDEKKEGCEIITLVFGKVIEILDNRAHKKRGMHLKENCAQELFYSCIAIYDFFLIIWNCIMRYQFEYFIHEKSIWALGSVCCCGWDLGMLSIVHTFIH